jgi:dienelactone hydrolase
MRLLSLCSLALMTLSLTACGDDGGGSANTPDSGAADVLDVQGDAEGDLLDTGPPEVTGPDVTGPDITGPDVSEPDVSEPDVSEPSWDAPPLAAESEAVEITDMAWRVMKVGNKADPVIGPLTDGSFTWPEEGVVDGYWWQDLAPDENGNFTPPSNSLAMYAVAKIDLVEPAGLIVRADACYQVFVNGARLPGDPYAHNQHRLAFRAEAGETLVVFRIIGWGRTPGVGIWRTPDELSFHTSDMTFPDLVAGDDLVQYVGVPVLNHKNAPVTGIRTRVVESEYLEEATLHFPAMGTSSATQLSFEIRPKAAITEGEMVIPATLRVESLDLDWTYETTVDLTSKDADPTVAPNVRRSYLSPVDASTQYYGLRRASEPDEGDGRGLLLSLHGAGVQGIGQSASYSSKPDLIVVGATNRRRFGFDWEVWGRLQGLNAMAHAKATHDIDPTRVYVSGHSMGGHGTWQLGTLFPGLFAVVGPSAGWISFATYGGDPFPAETSPFYWARRSSDTPRWAENLTHRAVYIIHGDADDNVPISQAHQMKAIIEPYVSDLQFHIEPGAGHWWDGDAAGGADCVDWPPLFETMEDRRLDPWETEFVFVSPSPWVSPTHSFVTIQSAATPAADVRVTSTHDGDTITLVTDNVRSLTLDAEGLLSKDVAMVVVDDEAYAVGEDDLWIGPEDGKTPDQYGPVTQVFMKPFCFVYDPAGPDEYRHIADYITMGWTIIGNGHACTLPWDALTDTIRAERNLIYLGIPVTELGISYDFLMGWDADTVSVGGHSFGNAALAAVFPEGDGLSAIFTATAGSETLLYGLPMWTSRFVTPDYMILGQNGALGVGFWAPDWSFEATLGQFAN